jgi:hypothetical protein
VSILLKPEQGKEKTLLKRTRLQQKKEMKAKKDLFGRKRDSFRLAIKVLFEREGLRTDNAPTF